MSKNIYFLQKYLFLKHEKLIRCIYDICWYELDCDDRRKIRLLLQATQEDVYIDFMFGALNLPLFLEVRIFFIESFEVFVFDFVFFFSDLQENLFGIDDAATINIK